MTRSQTEAWRRVLIGLIVLGTGYLVVMAVLLLREPEFVFAHGRSRDALDTTLESGWRVAPLHAHDDVRIEAIVVTPPTAPRATVLFLHGNASSIWSSHVRQKLRAYQQMGYQVVAVEYRGFGRTEGEPSEAGLIADGLAGARYAEESLGVRPDDLVIHGMSLGSGVAAGVAAQRRPRLLILDGAFSSLPAMVRELYAWLPLHFLMRNRFDTRARLDSIAAPVLHVHARDDSVVPFRFGEELAAVNSAPHAFFATEGGHIEGAFADTERFGGLLDSLLNGGRAR